MGETRKVYSNCIYTSNPYHECGGYCSGKNSKSQETKGRNGSDNRSGQVSKLMAKETTVHPACVNASNPYHECVELCFKKIAEAKGREYVKDSDPISRSIGRKNKEPKSWEKSPEMLHAYDVASPQLHFPSKTKAEFMDVEPRSSSEQQTVQEEDKQLTFSPVSPGRPMSLNFSGIARSYKSSDEDESQSVISDSDCRVRVGNYLVKESISFTLQSIFDKYGDIAANCKLESLSMRTSYLECLCFVVQELQSTVLMQLTKFKVKEMLAVLKDVESSGINVSWLQHILEETAGSIDLVSQQQAAEAAKFNCAQTLKSTKKELESVLKNLAIKEKEVEDDKVRVDKIKENLRELEFESSRLNNNILFIRSKLENFHCSALSDELP